MAYAKKGTSKMKMGSKPAIAVTPAKMAMKGGK